MGEGSSPHKHHCARGFHPLLCIQHLLGEAAVRVEMLLCEPKQPWGRGCSGSVTAFSPSQESKQGIKATQESEGIILKRASATQGCLVQCC